MADPFIGEVRMFSGNFAPLGFAFCDGQLMSIAQNTALFALIGTTYGGDGQQTFALPDLRSRIPIGMGQGPGMGNRNMGEVVGRETVTLLATQIPDHAHRQSASSSAALATAGPGGTPAPSATTSFYGNGAADTPLAATAVAAAGGSQPHNNMAPFLAVNFIIALEGIFPSRN